MVIGGYTEVEEKRRKIVPRAYPGPTNDIEIISKSRSCRKGVSPAFGFKFTAKDNDEEWYEADAIGPTGQFAKDAPIYCGGKSKRQSYQIEGKEENLGNCWEYDYRANKQVFSLLQKALQSNSFKSEILNVVYLQCIFNIEKLFQV